MAFSKRISFPEARRLLTPSLSPLPPPPPTSELESLKARLSCLEKKVSSIETAVVPLTTLKQDVVNKVTALIKEMTTSVNTKMDETLGSLKLDIAKFQSQFELNFADEATNNQYDISDQFSPSSDISLHHVDPNLIASNNPNCTNV